MKRVEKARVVVKKAKVRSGREMRRRKGERKMVKVDDIDMGVGDDEELLMVVRRRRREDASFRLYSGDESWWSEEGRGSGFTIEGNE